MAAASCLTCLQEDADFRMHFQRQADQKVADDKAKQAKDAAKHGGGGGAGSPAGVTATPRQQLQAPWQQQQQQQQQAPWQQQQQQLEAVAAPLAAASTVRSGRQRPKNIVDADWLDKLQPAALAAVASEPAPGRSHIAGSRDSWNV
jgi:hypothetical protein